MNSINPIPVPVKLLSNFNKRFDDYLHFTKEYDRAIANGAFYLAAELGSYLDKLSKENKYADKVLNNYIENNLQRA